MVRVPLSIESPDYWQSLSITSHDLDRVEELFYEDGLPHLLSEMAQRVVQGRLQDAAAERRSEVNDKVRLYQPKQQYETGERVRFSALNNAVGTVENVRPGGNPSIGTFSVMRVRMEPEGYRREFAIDYGYDHPLNVDEAVSAQPQVPADALSFVSRGLGERLARIPEYVTFGDYWFRRDLMLDVHIGHLNIAEAIIDVTGEPVPPSALLSEIELPPAAPAARAFALNYGLAHDSDNRFVNVGTPDAPLWALRGAALS